MQQSANDKAATLDQWKARREILATTPSGIKVRLRPPNIERHALAGGLPERLRALATAADKGAVIDAVMGSDGDEESQTEAAKATRDYMDGLVRGMVVEPSLEGVDLDDIPPIDYKWLIEVAFRDNDYDGEGRYLWGTEPLNRWSFFRDEHGCAEDCPACGRIRAAVSAAR